MTIEIGSWYFVTFVIAIAVAVTFFMVYRKGQQYRAFVVGKVKVVIHRDTGWPLTKVVEEMPDGWVRVGKGDYKLPKEEEQRKIFEALSDVEKHQLLGDRQVLPPAMEWTFYPETGGLGIKGLRTPIRTVHFYENDPSPRTWLGKHEPKVTSVEAQAHTRQMDALSAGIRAEQLEKQNKHMMEALAQTASKNVVYLLSGGSLGVGVIILIMLMRGSGG